MRVHNTSLNNSNVIRSYKKNPVVSQRSDFTSIQLKSNNFPQIAFMSNIAYPLIDKSVITRPLVKTGLDFIKSEFEKVIQKFPEDLTYYKQMAADIGLKQGEEFRLFPVVGKQQFLHILDTASPKDFSIGENFSGVKTRTFCINLHNHTTASDGTLEPLEALEKSTKYGDKIAQMRAGKFYMYGISDHDTMDGAQEIVKTIVQDPYKYRNLKLVTGSEISVSHIHPDDVKTPMDFEMMLYGANPFNKYFNGVLKDLRDNRISAVRSFIEDVNNNHKGLDLNWDGVKQFTPNLGKGTSNGGMWLARDYAEGEFKKKFGFITEGQKKDLSVLRDKYLKSGLNMINPKIALTPEKVFEEYSKSGDSGVFGVAHPGFLQAYMYSDKIANYCKNSYRQPAHHLVWVMFNRLQQQGKGLFKCSEVNYQSYGNDVNRAPWVNYMKEIAKELNLSKAGGVDCHTKHLFTKHSPMPQQTIRDLELEDVL